MAQVKHVLSLNTNTVSIYPSLVLLLSLVAVCLYVYSFAFPTPFILLGLLLLILVSLLVYYQARLEMCPSFGSPALSSLSHLSFPRKAVNEVYAISWFSSSVCFLHSVRMSKCSLKLSQV